ncbi:hypothetical protein [Rhizobium sp. SG2393]
MTTVLSPIRTLLSGVADIRTAVSASREYRRLAGQPLPRKPVISNLLPQ